MTWRRTFASGFANREKVTKTQQRSLRGLFGPQELKENAPEKKEDEDLEDGEIEDDDEEVPPPQPVIPNLPPQFDPQVPPPNFSPIKDQKPMFSNDRNMFMDKGPKDRRNRYEENKKKGHLTEAEKSVMYLHKMERMEREKRDKYRRDPTGDFDDFASNIEKAIANVLKKDKPGLEEEKDEKKRGKKRRKKNKDKKNKMHKADNQEEWDEGNNEQTADFAGNEDRTPSHSDDNESGESDTMEGNIDRKKNFNKKGNRNNRQQDNKNRKFNADQNKNKNMDIPQRDSNVCLYNLQGNCQKGDDCQYSHDVMMTMKLELCKFYLMDCCAKGDKCLYMHSEFPCKYYHTGLQCYAGDTCKFAHGKPLSDNLRQILFKHIETAPKEILGDFPRLSREGAVQRITQTQKHLEGRFCPNTQEGEQDLKAMNKTERQRRTRWQDPDPSEGNTNLQTQQYPIDNMNINFNSGMYVERDQDMRFNSNGDVDMRTLMPPVQQNLQPNLMLPTPTLVPPHLPNIAQKVDIEQYKRDAGLSTDFTKDVDIREFNQDVDIRSANFGNASSMDVDNRQQDIDNRQQQDVDIRTLGMVKSQDVDIRPNIFGLGSQDVDIRQYQSMQDIKKEEANHNLQNLSDGGSAGIVEPLSLPPNLSGKQRELYLRIQSQQKDNSTVVHQPMEESQQSDNEENINWYSDDDDDLKLTIKVDDEQKEEEKRDTIMSPPQQGKSSESYEKLGDISKIEISAEVSELLNQISQATPKEPAKEAAKPKDPRQQEPTKLDPRLHRRSSNDEPKPAKVEEKSLKLEKISIYEQGSMPGETHKDPDYGSGDVDLRSAGNTDVDLRNLGMNFKFMQNYTPATEIDASLSSHNPLQWKVYIVEIPKPDYTGLKLTPQDAQTTGDPRLRKIFRLGSTEEKDSPASPKAESSSKPSGPPRIDPRRRKLEESKDMSYSQQLTVLQNSAFYQSLTSNQKVLLNHELAARNDQSGNNDTILNGILSNLGLIQQGSTPANQGSLNILANVNNMNPAMMGPNPNMMGPRIPIPGAPNAGPPIMNPNMLAQNPNLMNTLPPGQMGQPGILGPGPGIPQDFPINFDPRNGGLLGNAPFSNFPPENNFSSNNYNNDDFFDGNNFNSGGRGGPDRNFRDRNRRSRGYNRGGNGGNRNFRNRNHNRSNRSHSPP